METKQTLMQIIGKSAQIESFLVDNGGELTPEVELMIFENEVALATKVDNYAYLIDRLKMVSEDYKTRAEFFSKVSKSVLASIEFLKDRVKFGMEQLGQVEILGGDRKFLLANSPAAALIEDESLLPEKYRVTQTITSIDKKALLADLKAGIEVPGCRINQGTHVRIGNNKGTK